MKRLILAIAFAALLLVMFGAGAISAIYYFVNPLMKTFYLQERDLLESQVFAMERITEGSTREAEDVLRIRSYSALAVLSDDENFDLAVKSRPSLGAAVEKLCATKSAFLDDKLPTGKDKAGVQKACDKFSR